MAPQLRQFQPAKLHLQLEVCRVSRQTQMLDAGVAAKRAPAEDTRREIKCLGHDRREIVLAGNFDLYDFCHLHGQAGRRMRDLYFPRYHFDTPTECEEFVGALRSLLEHVPLIVDVPGLLTHWRWFGEWSLGCIGVLSDWLVETVDALCKRGETTLTIDALQKHALPPDLRARMEREARAGEFKMDQAKAQSEQELQRLLGNPAPVPGTAPTTTHHANGASAPKASPDAHRGTHSQTRVERAAARDSVGDQVQTRNSPKLSFIG